MGKRWFVDRKRILFRPGILRRGPPAVEAMFPMLHRIKAVVSRAFDCVSGAGDNPLPTMRMDLDAEWEKRRATVPTPAEVFDFDECERWFREHPIERPVRD